jgi:hypothetical protein
MLNITNIMMMEGIIQNIRGSIPLLMVIFISIKMEVAMWALELGLGRQDC